MDNFQKPEETEINLIDLLFYCLRKWRPIVVCMVVFALLAGAYKYHDVSSENAAALAAAALSEDEDDADTDDADADEEADAADADETDADDEDDADADEADEADEDEDTDDDSGEVVNPMVTYYNTAIEEKQAYLDSLFDYIDTSVLMSIDPHDVDTASVTFYLKTADKDTLSSLVAAYENCVTGGTLASALLEAEESTLTESDLQYAISFSSDSTAENTIEISSGETVAIESSADTDSRTALFKVTVIAESPAAAEEFTGIIQSTVEDYSAEVSALFGTHTISLISAEQTTAVNTTLESYQNSILSSYSTALNDLISLQASLETVIEEQGETVTSGTTVTLASPVKGAIKYGIIGLILGAFLAVVVLALIYLLGGRLFAVEDFRAQYGMSVLARINSTPKKRRLFGFIDRLIDRLQRGAYSGITYEEQLKIAAANIRTAAANSGVANIMAAGSISKEDAEGVLSAVRAELGKSGGNITLSEYERIVFSADALEALAGYDGILFLEKTEVSFTRLIDEERGLAAARNIPILGAVILE